MSWGSEAASGASTAGNAASNAASTGSAGAGFSSAPVAANGVSIYGQMADIGGSQGGTGLSAAGNASQAPATGFGLGADANGYTPNGWEPSTVKSINEANASLADHGSVNSTWDNAVYGTGNALGKGFTAAYNGLDKFQKGGEQNLLEAWRTKAWDNPGTYGYLAAKLQGMGGGGRPTAPTMVTNVSYQQPENAYLKKRGY